jgi:hypothetical protein
MICDSVRHIRYGSVRLLGYQATINNNRIVSKSNAAAASLFVVCCLSDISEQ